MFSKKYKRRFVMLNVKAKKINLVFEILAQTQIQVGVERNTCPKVNKKSDNTSAKINDKIYDSHKNTFLWLRPASIKTD